MSEPILDPHYWHKRLTDAPDRNPHHALFECSDVKWAAIEAKHREILARVIGSRDSVLDAGCAWGRLLYLMPPKWRGDYLGVDITPKFLQRGRQEHPGRSFVCSDLRHMVWILEPYDWVVLVSIRPMVKRHLGDEVWAVMERELRRVSRKRLYLEYDENDEGVVE